MKLAYHQIYVGYMLIFACLSPPTDIIPLTPPAKLLGTLVERDIPDYAWKSDNHVIYWNYQNDNKNIPRIRIFDWDVTQNTRTELKAFAKSIDLLKMVCTISREWRDNLPKRFLDAC